MLLRERIACCKLRVDINSCDSDMWGVRLEYNISLIELLNSDRVCKYSVALRQTEAEISPAVGSTLFLDDHMGVVTPLDVYGLCYLLWIAAVLASYWLLQVIGILAFQKIQLSL